jgi:hypothetical protein
VLLDFYRIIVRAIQHQHVICCYPPRGKSKPDTVIPKISQDTLAEKTCTARSRVSFILSNFESGAS